MGPVSFHIGFDFFHENNGVLCFASHKYIDNMGTSMRLLGSLAVIAYSSKYMEMYLIKMKLLTMMVE